MSQATPRIICIANQKGGVGKTTTAVNLAASLARLGARCLLVDMDPQGNATSGLGLDKKTVGAGNVYRVLVDGTPMGQVVRDTETPGLAVVPASIDLIGAEVELVGVPEREHRLASRLSPEAEAHDYVLIDCPPSLGLLTVNALVAARSVLVPVQCEYYALEGLSQLLNSIALVKQSLNPSLRIEGFLLTMADSRNRLSGQVEAEVRRHFEARVFATVIPRNVRLSEAPSHGRPALVYDPLSRGALAYLAAARELALRTGFAPSADIEERGEEVANEG